MSLIAQFFPNNTDNLTKQLKTDASTDVDFSSYDYLSSQGEGGVKYNGTIPINTQEMSFSMWFKLNNGSGQHLIDMRIPGGQGYQPLHVSSQKIQYHCGGNKTSFEIKSDNTIIVAPNQWHNIIIVVNNSDVKCWLDDNGNGGEGIVMKSTNQGNSPIKEIGDFPLYIGCRYEESTPTSYLDGKIVDVRIYNHCLSEDEIKKISVDFNPYLTNNGEFHSKGFVEKSGKSLLTKCHLEWGEIEEISDSTVPRMEKGIIYMNEFIEE